MKNDNADYVEQFKPLRKRYYMLFVGINLFLILAFFSFFAVKLDLLEIKMRVGPSFFFICAIFCAFLQLTIVCPRCKRCVFFLKIPIIMMPGIPKECRNCGAKLFNKGTVPIKGIISTIIGLPIAVVVTFLFLGITYDPGYGVGALGLWGLVYIVCLFSSPLLIIGLILGILSLKEKANKILSWSGIILNALGLIIAIISHSYS